MNIEKITVGTTYHLSLDPQDCDDIRRAVEIAKTTSTDPDLRKRCGALLNLFDEIA